MPKRTPSGRQSAPTGGAGGCGSTPTTRSQPTDGGRTRPEGMRENDIRRHWQNVAVIWEEGRNTEGIAAADRAAYPARIRSQYGESSQKPPQRSGSRPGRKVVQDHLGTRNPRCRGRLTRERRLRLAGRGGPVCFAQLLIATFPAGWQRRKAVAMLVRAGVIGREQARNVEGLGPRGDRYF